MNGKSQTIILGGGCFWCLEAVFQRVPGVVRVTSGYAGGEFPDPTYDDVCTGLTGHAEVIRLEFEPSLVSLSELLRIFWLTHDPTTFERQGYDVGNHYRSIILYTSPGQIPEIQRIRDIMDQGHIWKEPFVTQIAPLADFYDAEPYHQNFYNMHRLHSYCQLVINPKLKALDSMLKPPLDALKEII